jgi:hypothetical protein
MRSSVVKSKTVFGFSSGMVGSFAWSMGRSRRSLDLDVRFMLAGVDAAHVASHWIGLRQTPRQSAHIELARVVTLRKCRRHQPASSRRLRLVS